MWKFLKNIGLGGDATPTEEAPELVEDAGDGIQPISGTMSERINQVITRASKGFVAVGFRVPTHRVGTRRSNVTGAQGEFLQTTEYVPGDHDRRQIMARATARTGGREIIARVCRPEAQATLYILGDINRTLDWGSSRLSKLELMACCLATACMSLKKSQDLVKIALYANNTAQHVMPRPRIPNIAIRQMLPFILDPVYSDGSVGSGLEGAFKVVPARGKKECLLLSDFLNFTPEQYDLLALRAKLNNVRAVVIQDRRERELPEPEEGRLLGIFPAGIQVFDMETGKQETWWLNDQTRTRYRQEFEAHEERLKAFFKENNISYTIVQTDDKDAMKKVVALLASPPLLRT